MSRIAVVFAFVLLGVVTNYAQPSMREVNQYIIGAWEGPMVVTARSGKFIEGDTILHVEFYITSRITFEDNGKFDIELLSTDEVKIIDSVNPSDPTLKTFLEAKSSYQLFIKNNEIETLRYNTIPQGNKNPLLVLEIEINTDSLGDRLDYLKEDLRKIQIAAISADQMTLLIPTRSNWSEEKQAYMDIVYKQVTLRKVVE